MSLLARLQRDHRGFTLVETLVAMVTGLVVSGALFAILEVSLHQSSRLSEVAQATQLGRSSMNRIVDAMHSGCVKEKFTPVQAGSTKSKMILISGYSEEAEVPTKATLGTGIHKDEFEWVEGTHRLIDKSSLSSKEVSAGVYSWEAAKEIRLGENIRRTITIEKEVEKEATAMFTYYEYDTTANPVTGEASDTLKPIAEFKGEGESLTEAQAKKVASVSVAFNQRANEGKEAKKTGRPVNLNSQVTFTFSAPDAEASIVAGPCE